jgi:hypothetical protein
MCSSPRTARLSLAAAILAWALPAFARAAAAPANRGSRTAGPQGAFKLDVPAHPLDLILARPEATSVTLSLLAYEDLEVAVDYGPAAAPLAGQTPAQTLRAGVTAEIVLAGLQPDTAYRYQLRSRTPGAVAFSASPDYSFHTARAPGAAFAFTLTADVHLDEHTAASVYLQSLANIRADRPDFHLDLGNLFMTDKHATRAEAARQYLAQRYYLGQIGTSVPVLLALGTHDGESGKDRTGADALAAWAHPMRTRYFPNPVPDRFYSGNTTAAPSAGPSQNYYAWEWGDALFVVLDPFSYTLPTRGRNDGWGWTLGEAQYRWLARTLAASRAAYKFVFIHNLLSGDQASRGGIEIAGFNEWGGRNPDGTEGLAQHRPGWEMPVHQLLVRNHVDVVFRAHDNFYARQELDGITYLMVPQPSFAGDDRIRDLQNYGYKVGTFLGNAGHVRVSVSPAKVTIDYVKSTPDRKVADSSVITRRAVPGAAGARMNGAP